MAATLETGPIVCNRLGERAVAADQQAVRPHPRRCRAASAEEVSPVAGMETDDRGASLGPVKRLPVHTNSRRETLRPSLVLVNGSLGSFARTSLRGIRASWNLM